MLLCLVWLLFISLFVICFIVRNKNSKVLKNYGKICRIIGCIGIVLLCYDMLPLLQGFDIAKNYILTKTGYDYLVSISLCFLCITCFLISNTVKVKTKQIL